MEYLVPLAAVVVIGLLTSVLAGRIGRRASGGTPPAPTSGLPFEVGEERAREAAGLLDERGHRAVYGHIAQGRVMEAVRAYRSHTGRSRLDAVTDVQSLAAHPQVWRPRAEPPRGEPAADRVAEGGAEQSGAAGSDLDQGPQAAAQAGGGEPGREPEVQGGSVAEPAQGRRTEDAEDDGDGEPDAPLMVPAEWAADPAPEAAPFDVEVERGEDTVRVSSRDLPPWLRDQLTAMVRDGNLESAAVQLSSHSDLTVPEAFEVLRRLREQREGR